MLEDKSMWVSLWNDDADKEERRKEGRRVDNEQARLLSKVHELRHWHDICRLTVNVDVLETGNEVGWDCCWPSRRCEEG